MLTERQAWLKVAEHFDEESDTQIMYRDIKAQGICGALNGLFFSGTISGAMWDKMRDDLWENFHDNYYRYTGYWWPRRRQGNNHRVNACLLLREMASNGSRDAPSR